MSLNLTLSPSQPNDSIPEEWSHLLSRITPETPFSTWEWQSLWWSHFGQQGKWSVFAVREQGEVIGIAPLYWEAESGYLKFIGGEDLSDYLDILSLPGREPQVWDEILKHLHSSPRGINGLDLHCLPANSPTLQALPSLAQSLGYRVMVEVEEVCPILKLPESWEAYLSLLNGKDRHELRRKIRKAEAASPPLRFRQCSEEECARQDIKSFICLHRKSRPDKEAFMNEQREGFFQEASKTFAQKGWLRLYILEREAMGVAAMLCFDYGKTLYLYNSGHDPELSFLSPGIVLIGYCLQDAISLGKQCFDFMRGKEGYKYRLGGKDSPIYRILVERP